MAVAAVIGTVAVLISSFFDGIPKVEQPDGILRAGIVCRLRAQRRRPRGRLRRRGRRHRGRGARAARRRVPDAARSATATGTGSASPACRHDAGLDRRSHGGVLVGRRAWRCGDRRRCSPGDDTLVLDLDAGECFEVPDDIARVDDHQRRHDRLRPSRTRPRCSRPASSIPDRDRPYPDDEQQLFARVDRPCAAVLADLPISSSASACCPSWPTNRRGTATADATSASRFRTAAAPRKGRSASDDRRDRDC